ncbi:MAG: hypothetical protein K2G67_08310 [Muribaculaceae bacterium]|nr:hypothetical protein [Muribaculaceae bacterium]
MKNKFSDEPATDRRRIRAAMERLAIAGLLFVAIGLVAPFASMGNLTLMLIFKWIFAAGAFLYTVARIVGAWGKDESFRVRRLRRMEAWAGIAFCIAAFFWFYNTRRFDGFTLTFKMLNETIIFTLAGALIQIVASWSINSALKKENKG